jgi:hypothetical protein
MNADYNASKNIACSLKIVDKKEDCEFYRLGQQAKGEVGEAGEYRNTLETETPMNSIKALTDPCMLSAA